MVKSDIGIINDVIKAYSISNGTREYDFRKVYPNSNENLKDLFSTFPIEGKNVFCVLSSGDQVFNSFYFGAKKIDVFDNNRLTFYYYYLRLWVIRYLKEEYITDEMFDNSNLLMNLILKVEANSEEEKKAQLFWIKYFTKYGKLDRYLFLTQSTSFESVYKNDLEGLSKKIKNIKFYNIDMCTRFDLKKKYDVVILSNMLECMHQPARLLAARDNIERLLKKDGICICSHLIAKENDEYHKKEIEILTAKKLVEEEIYCNHNNLGYVYKRGVK